MINKEQKDLSLFKEDYNFFGELNLLVTIKSFNLSAIRARYLKSKKSGNNKVGSVERRKVAEGGIAKLTINNKGIVYSEVIKKMPEPRAICQSKEEIYVSSDTEIYSLKNEGIKLASRGIAAAKRMKDGLSEIRGYQIMAEIFRKKKDYKSAVMYQMIYTKFYEDFYQRNDRQQVAEIEHQFAIQKLERRIEELTQK